ncbi:perlucin-like protein isoform X2 [Syngnathus typhle]|uniref:perlucin-like protein isoform X2 n=1 Tax=Syngnathus typhle TaxID=161592 RepID=UPI002A6B7073|nr:perlucin-like protein isoform X2 [Syngnathus typhle]
MITQMSRLHLLLVFCGIVALSQAVSQSTDCPPGWTQLDQNCYVYQCEPRSFLDAESVCNILGGNLVSIGSAKENAVVIELIREGAGAMVDTWIGLHDAILEDDFVWTDGRIVDFRNFGPNQPDNNAGNEDCVEIEATADPLWNDDTCTEENTFVCIKPVVKNCCH